MIFASRVLGTTNFLRKRRLRARKREREKMFLSPGTRSRNFQRRILLTFQAAGRRRRRLKRNPCADGKLLEIIASAETLQTLNESRAFGLFEWHSNNTRRLYERRRLTVDVYAIRKFHDPARATERKERGGTTEYKVRNYGDRTRHRRREREWQLTMQ